MGQKTEIPDLVRLSDYRVPDFLVDRVHLDIDLGDALATVTAELALRRNPDAADTAPLILDGQHQDLLSVAVNGAVLAPDAYEIRGDQLHLASVPDSFTLTIISTNKPQENTALEGLYLSGGMYCTQCEPEGFRRITWFPDRPDVMAIFTTTIRADPARFPVLLSNGNLVEAGECADGSTFATWHDPFPKPAYLFAMVAGDLACVEDSYTTGSGRQITLRIFVEHGDEGRCDHAMDALKRSMRWDEERFGLEYDLDLFMIVAVSHFNMGAMENKGLNIFNSRYILADRDTASDRDFQLIEAIVAHEYFHNWTGNRVTCRDWFQLSLKEGLTVFRDQEFTADAHSRAVKRIADARAIRSMQFVEDASPTAHPVRPASYMEINNFYTVTVYEKGAEVVRMIHTRIGEAGFRAGMDLYFARHDGEAVRCEDFVAAMQDASGVDLSDMQVWYEQAGTPHLTITSAYDAAARQLELVVEQATPATPGQPDKQPLPIPLRIGMLDAKGRALPLKITGDNDPEPPAERMLMIDAPRHAFRFDDMPPDTVPSVLRGFSAPVEVVLPRTPDELALLAAHDPDPFARWDAGRQYAEHIALALVAAHGDGAALTLPAGFVDAVAATLGNAELEPAFIAQTLHLPDEGELAQAMDVADVAGIHAATSFMATALGTALWEPMCAAYETALAAQDAGALSTEAMGWRALANAVLRFLAAAGPEGQALAGAQFRAGQSMTLTMGALIALNPHACAEREAALAAFHDRWQDRPVVLDKWFALKATAPASGTLGEVERLLDHPRFDLGNPNRVRALIGAFVMGNPTCFHSPDGAGYRFLGGKVLELEARNPQVAARLVHPLTRWARYDAGRQGLMKAELEKIAGASGLSKDVLEIAVRGLG